MTTSGPEQLAEVRRRVVRASKELARDLPWIGERDPWAIFVAEVMLQQTQTHRVVEPWRRFLQAFPTPTALANASLAQVLRHWEGLGYHRRAKNLQAAARRMRDQHAGKVPADVAELRALPGVGPYTAHAVASFAFGTPVAVLDTNVGRVLARCLANRTLAPAEARELAARLLPAKASASFNQTMLDLGAQFCRAIPRCPTCPVVDVCAWRREGGDDPAPRSAAVSKPQAPFTGSRRQLRGRVLAVLRAGSVTRAGLARAVADVDADRLDEVLEALERDGLISRARGRLHLATT